jgi:hypothetical protein
MSKEWKSKLDEAFDEGRLNDLPADLLSKIRSDSEAAEHFEQLLSVERELAVVAEGSIVSVPAGFREAVLKRLPSQTHRSVRALQLHDLLLFTYFTIVAVACFIFRDALGLTAFFDMLAGYLKSAGDIPTEVSFSLLSSFAILIISWAIVSSFFGIKSRRITK